MNDEIISKIAKELDVLEKYVKETLKMLEEGSTIAFIARYRKEKTNALSEDKIKYIKDCYDYEVNLYKKKEDVIRLIDEKGLLTDELKNSILKCEKLVEIEDIYRPFKEKKKTKASDAIKNGLEPLAKIIMSCPLKGNEDEIAGKFLNDNVKTSLDAIKGASYIIAEWISDNSFFRKYIRNFVYKNGIINSKLKKDAKDEKKIYEMYYSYTESVKTIKPHRILAINRGEKENILSVKIDINDELIIDYLNKRNIKDDKSFCSSYIKDAVKDSYKRLIYPSIEREIRSDLTIKAIDSAINNFSKNLECLLLTPPIKEKNVLAFDPGFVNGCKIAVIDKTGKYLDSTVIKPFLKNITNEKVKKYKDEIVNLINKYNAEIIAIGNGTASRESEKFCADLIKEYNLGCKYVIVSEAGASIYSATKMAIEEFPELEVEKRSAVSIGRRIQDPLSELVKIPPESIGVGLYQHDVQGKKLTENLNYITEKCVNEVGVNVNTASSCLLKYVSGLNKTSIDKIMDYKNKKGIISSRKELKKILSSKAYEQSIGFLKIVNGLNTLDQTFIHPESYDITLKLLKMHSLTLKDIGKESLVNTLDNIDKEKILDELNTDIFTLEDIISSLKKPNLDPRDSYPQPILKSDVLDINDLNVGMKLQGTIRNVVDFGAFVDIGLHNDGLIHISKISKDYVKHPTDILQVGDIVDCYVININKEKGLVNLSMFKE